MSRHAAVLAALVVSMFFGKDTSAEAQLRRRAGDDLECSPRSLSLVETPPRGPHRATVTASGCGRVATYQRVAGTRGWRALSVLHVYRSAAVE